MTRPTFKAWITKYALTKGIEELEVELCDATSTDMIQAVGTKYPTYFHIEGRDWHRSRDVAVVRAENMRQKKIKALNDKIRQITALRF